MKRLLLLITICISSVSFGQVPSYVPTNGLVGWWGFNGNANDESGNGNNGTVNGATLTSDRFSNANSAYSYDGNDWIQVPHDPSINFTNTDSYSLSVWYYGDNYTTQGQSILEKWSGSGTYPYQIRYGWNVDSSSYGLSSGSYDGTLPTNTVSIFGLTSLNWNHVVINYENFQKKMYHNGVLVNVDNTVIDAFSNIDDLFIGRRGNSSTRFYYGDIDDIGIWNRALTQCEISELYHAQQFTPPVLAVSDTTSACGASTTLDAGTDPAWASYLWNTTEDTQTISVSNSGLYTVEVTDTNGCIGYDTTLVSIIDPTIDQIDTNICIGDGIVLDYSFCNYPPQELFSNLIAFYPFCGNANDASGNGYHGTVNGANLTADRFGNLNMAYHFNGSNNFIDVSSIQGVLSNSDAVSLNCWFKTGFNTNSPPWMNTIFAANYQTPTDNIFRIGVDYLGEIHNAYTSSSYLFGTGLNDNTWKMLTYVRNQGPGIQNFSIFINGILIGSGSEEISWQIATLYVLGAEYDEGIPSDFFNGKIDDIGIWNRTLTPTEIQQLFELGSYDITWSTGDTTASITVQPTTTTTYSVTVSDGISSCVDDVTITVNDPQVDAGVDVDVCNGDDITLSGSGADTYAWSGGVTDGVAFGPTVSEYYYVTGTDTLGCEDNDSVYVTMLQPTTNSITATNCDSYTAPDGATYTSTGNYTAVVPNAVGCDSTITIDLTITNSSSSSITETVCDTYTAPDGQTYTSSGNYTAVIPNAEGCDSTITIDLTVNALTTLDGGADITVCEGDSVVLSGSGAQSYAWNNSVTDGTYFTPTVGTTTYTVTGTDANGCSDTDDVAVTVSSTPVLTLTATSPDCQGEATGLAQADVTGGTSPYDFVWSNGALTSTNANIAAGSYSVTVTDNAGCEATGTVVVTDSSEPCFYIPGGLSPNGDNNNDTWGVAGLNNYPEAKVMVYNRWGQLLYDAGPDDAPWDGTYLGEELPTADYYYIIDLGNGDTFNGVVTLKR